MTIVLFDWNLGGHHAKYIRHFSKVLGRTADIVVAAPDKVLATLSDLPIVSYSLGAGRPAVDYSRPLGIQHKELATAELDLLEKTAAEVHPDRLINLYGDQVIRRFVQRPPLAVPVSFCIFFVRDHYPALYGSKLSGKELLRAWFLRWNIERWRSRPDADTLFFLDENAVAEYRRRGLERVYWLPEPPVARLTKTRHEREREGAAVYGALARRKGIDLIAKAITNRATHCSLKLAGSLDPQFAPELLGCVSEMRTAGAQVHVSDRYHDELEGLEFLAGARCAVLAYPRHYGMSRVLLEAASVGTPVIAHDYGLLGYLVRKHNLGLAIDCANSRTLGEALEMLAGDGEMRSRFESHLRHFALHYSESVFEAAVCTPFRTTSVSF